MRTWVERVVVRSDLTSHIARWKQMRREGWELEALLSHDHKQVVCVGFLDEQIPLFDERSESADLRGSISQRTGDSVVDDNEKG